MNQYVHGYSEREAQRLNDQANTIADLLHYDSVWPAGSMILEAGCGVGAQTQIIAPKNAQSQFVSIDISHESIAEAKEKIAKVGIHNVSLNQADIFNLSFEDESFDHIFLCFVLEHLPNPKQALTELNRVLKMVLLIFIQIVKRLEKRYNVKYFYNSKKEEMLILEGVFILF